jgi:general secretion pathway protein F
MVKAGESGGFLEAVLNRLSQYLGSRKELRDQILSMMLYPIILTIVSGLSVIILMTFVIPRFARIFSDLGQTIPVPTMILLTISQMIRDYWWLGVGLLLLFYFGLKAYNMDPERKLLWDKLKLRWILFGDILKKREVAVFSRTLGTLLQSGVTILSALNLVREIPQNLAISRSILYLHDRLREGKSFSKSMEETGVFPSLAIEMAHVGEETGRLDEVLIKIAETYEANIQTTLKRVISLLEPILILVMGGIVGFIVLSMLLAIFSINEIPF